MDLICNMKNCTGCGACVQICLQKCISFVENKEGFLYPRIDSKKCINCGKCKKVCPENENVSRNAVGTFYKAWAMDKNIIKNSSSGGVFSVLAEPFFKNGGIVFGAYQIDKPLELFHKPIFSVEELKDLRKSKYYQSNIGDSYIQVKNYLLEKRRVLFSGTACQIAGLYNFLTGMDIEGLLTVEVLCHGIASKKLVGFYINSMERKYRKSIRQVEFRIKEKISWEKGGGTGGKLYFYDGTSIVIPYEIDTFKVGYNNDLILRKSCYYCKYIGQDRIADFTLADYWGVEGEDITDEQLSMGVSLVVANNTEAKDYLWQIKENLYYKEVKKEKAIKYNQAFYMNRKCHPKRKEFFKKVDEYNYNFLIYRYFKRYYLKKIIKKLVGPEVDEKIRQFRRTFFNFKG